MADLRIVDAPLLSTVKGTEKIPTGGEGNFSISVNQVADFAKLKWFLATEGYIDNAVGNVQADLNLHKNNSSNPHQVTKEQVGLGNVDNTADLDKPVSNATQSAIITANSGKADKSYVDSQDQLKVDKNTVEAALLLKADKVDLKASKIESDGGQTQQVINDFGGAKWYAKLGGYGLGSTVKLDNGDTVKSTAVANTANPNVNMTGWRFDDNTVESIADLISINNPKDGQIANVSHFDKSTGRLKGGGLLEYNSAKSTINDGALCFDGWERPLVLNTYTPYMSGCYGDGVTDETVNLDKLMYALEVNNLHGKVVLDGDFFFNSQCPRIGKLIDPAQFNEKNAIRLVSNVDLLITKTSTLKFGSFFQGTAEQPKCNLLSAIYREDSSDWYGRNRHENINIYGGGTFDFTEAASVTAVQDGYRWIFKASIKNMKIYGLTFKGGDFANAVQTSKTTENVEIYDCHFENLISNASQLHDHSTIYCIGKNIKVHDNTFVMSNVKGRLNACACELHGSEQWFYNNRVFGYPNLVFSAILRTDQSLDENEVVYDQRVYDNYAEISRSALGYWSILDKTAKLKDLEFYDNTIHFIEPPSLAEFNAAGITATAYPSDLSASLFTTWVEGNAVSGVAYLAEVTKGIVIRNNTQTAVASLLENHRVSMVRFFGCYVRENLKIKNNSLQLNCLLNRDVYTGTVNDYFDGWFIKGNDIDFSKHINQYHSFYIFLEYMKDCVFDFDLNTSFSAIDKTYNFINLNFVDSGKVIGNTVKVNPNNSYRAFNSWVGGSLLNYKKTDMQGNGNYLNSVAFVYILESRQAGNNVAWMGVQSGAVPPATSVGNILDYTEVMLSNVSYPTGFNFDYSGSYKLSALAISFTDFTNTETSDRFAYMKFIC